MKLQNDENASCCIFSIFGIKRKKHADKNDGPKSGNENIPGHQDKRKLKISARKLTKQSSEKVEKNKYFGEKLTKQSQQPEVEDDKTIVDVHQQLQKEFGKNNLNNELTDIISQVKYLQDDMSILQK